MKKDYSKQPILITGAARSGTSMVAGIIHHCGAWKGDTVGPNKYNAKGMFENHALRQNVIKPYFSDIGMDKLGQFPLPKTDRIKIPHNFDEKVFKSIRNEGWKEELPWMYKCAKMCLIWPVWNYSFPDSKVIIVRRRTADIVNSCLKTGFMRAYGRTAVQKLIKVNNEYDGWVWWVNYHERKFMEMIGAGMNVKFVWPERMIHSNYEQMKEAIEWLGLEWDEKAVINFIEPKLWKARKK